MWSVEIIPDADIVFSRVHKDMVSKDGFPRAAAFSNTPKTGPDLSSDWNKYFTAEQSRDQIGKQKKTNGDFKNANMFYIWQFKVDALRNTIVPNQIVNHDPIFNDPEDDAVPNNRAHSAIIGNKPVNDAEFRVLMIQNGEWSIPPEK